MAESVAGLRELVRHRATDRCEYCRLPQSAEPDRVFHLEHVVAHQHGGPTVLPNLCWACQSCNLHKGPNLSGVDQLSGGIVMLYHPRRDRWDDHFLTLADGSVQGRTASGRATVAVLRMNGINRPVLRSLNP